jgi:predicted GNAT family acetyltransferase
MKERFENAEVINNEKDRQFEIRIDGYVARVPYGFKDDTIALFHTEVPKEIEGHGLGTKLAVYALNYAKDNGLKILLYCPFIASYIKKHPEWKQYIKHIGISANH